MKFALGGHLYASASSSADLCAPFLPVQTSFFLPPLLIREASRTLNLCFCITGLLCCFFSPPFSRPGLLPPHSSPLCSGNRAGRAHRRLAISTFAFFQHKSANKQCGNQRAGVEWGWGVAAYTPAAIFKLWLWKPLCLSPLNLCLRCRV